MWQRGSNHSLMGQCCGCRLPATLRDPISEKAYTAGYLNPVARLLDPDIGVEYLFSNDLRLNLAPHEIVAQGKIIKESSLGVSNSNEQLTRYYEFKSATGCRGLSTPIVMLDYTDASTFFEYPIAHCTALGLHSQIIKQMRECIGFDQFNSVCRRFGKRCAFTLRPSLLKRPVTRMLPE